jgi:hypothetical protein
MHFKDYQKIIIIIIVVFIANILYLSIGFSQTNINIRAYVPETEFNKNSNKVIELSAIKTESKQKENKYLYYFEKYLLKVENDKTKDSINNEAQTGYDRFASHILMWFILFIIAVFTALVMKIIDKYYMRIRNKLKKK